MSMSDSDSSSSDGVEYKTFRQISRESCMFHGDGGLRSFEHPMNRMKAMPRVDSEGVMCGANFKVDVYSGINSMPRIGSAADWTSWADAQP